MTLQRGAIFRTAVSTLLLTCQASLLTVQQAFSAPTSSSYRLNCQVTKFRAIDQIVNPDQKWSTYDEFKAQYLSTAQRAAVVHAEVSEVPCNAKGCCSIYFSFRPGSTDIEVFHQVYIQHQMGVNWYQYWQTHQPQYIMDLGANAGFTSSLFALMFPNAQIVSVEADEDNYRTALLNTLRFPNVKVVHAGIWSKQTYLKATQDTTDKWGFRFVEVAKDTPGSTAATTISHLMRHFNFTRLDILKMDVEGAEGIVFSPDADLSWLDYTSFIVAELHDYADATYGVPVVDTVWGVMNKQPFNHTADNEHTYWLRNKAIATSKKPHAGSKEHGRRHMKQ